MAPLEHQGCALFYEVSGAGPPVVLIQGGGVHGNGWRPPITMPQAAALRAYNGNPHLPGLAGLPTLVLNATFDPIAPPQTGRAMAEQIAGARYIELFDAAHGATVQCAAQVNDILREHFAAADA